MKNTKVTAHYLALPMDDARSAWITRARLESGRIADARSWMESNGFEIVNVDKECTILSDGREVLHEHGRSWALLPEVHAKRLAAAFEYEREAKERRDSATKSVAGTDSLSSIMCPKCGDSLQHTTVCPACAAGKLGYRHRYTCVCGGTDLISKEVL